MSHRALTAIATLCLSISLLLATAPASLAVTRNVAFGNSYAVELDHFGVGGSVTHKVGSGISNYLRATAAGDAVGSPTLLLLSIRQGRISSSSVAYSGANGGSITLRLNGDFTRELTGGLSIVSGASFRHQIGIALRDLSTGKDIRNWVFADEEILCGGLVYPVGLGGCNGTPAETYASAITRTATGSGVLNGHQYVIRVYVGSWVSAAGIAFGLQAKTTAKNMSGSLSW
jgi:hypothetical protein